MIFKFNKVFNSKGMNNRNYSKKLMIFDFLRKLLK